VAHFVIVGLFRCGKSEGGIGSKFRIMNINWGKITALTKITLKCTRSIACVLAVQVGRNGMQWLNGHFRRKWLRMHGIGTSEKFVGVLLF
jgi:hypothetical protein